MPRLTIAGYYGFGNAGDEAILEATVGTLRKCIPGAEFTVLTNDPPTTRAACSVNVVSRFSPFAVLKAIRDSDMFLFGGGSLLQDVTSLRSLAYYLSLLFAAQSLGKPTMIYANGFGPVNSWLGKALTRMVVNRVSAITLRDSDSARQIEMIGVNRPPVSVTADPAFTLESAGAGDAGRILEEAGVKPDGRPLVGVSLRPWAGGDRLVTVMAEACDMIRDNLGATVVLMPMQQVKDGPVACQVSRRMRGPAAVLTRPCTPRQLMACTELMDVVIGMRLHSLIFGVASAVPVAGIVYDPKIEAFLEAAGCPALGAPGEVAARTVLETVGHLLENAVAVRERLARRRDDFRRLAIENALIASKILASH
ncbi:MAG: polysaccharide pyruvyl transferase CsaB, partial [Bacillota bacterium]